MVRKASAHIAFQRKQGFGYIDSDIEEVDRRQVERR